MRTGNPALNAVGGLDVSALSRGDRMTAEGTALKAGLLGMLVAGMAWGLFLFGPAVPALLPIAQWGGLLGGLVLAVATIARPAWAPITAPLYAMAEGAFLGAMTLVFEARYPGIGFQAVGLTSMVFVVMMGLYRTGTIQVTAGLRSGVIAATGGIALFYVVALGLSFFGVSVPMVFGSGPVGILFSLFVVGLASFNLLLDFDAIERMVRRGAPSSMEWYGAFSLLVTLVWLYLEVLRLLAKLQSRD